MADFGFEKAADAAVAKMKQDKADSASKEQATLKEATELEGALKKLSQRTDMPPGLKIWRDRTDIHLSIDTRQAVLQVQHQDFYSFNIGGEQPVLCGQEHVAGVVLEWLLKGK